MHITRVELENIKSHAQAAFEFQRGTTAITGANGAGKTTIIEAIAWTLFDLLDYKKDDFARRGAKTKGVARVTFESGLDEREYVIYRDTANGYYVFDPQLKTRIADKKEEVSRFLWQHLGVEAGTDLETLFRRAIGVPQGTFTAIFMETATERKKAFDKLLKVEEYRQGAEKLRETVNFVRAGINAAQVKIARAEGELMRLETFENEHKIVSEQIENLSGSLEKLNSEVAEKRAEVKSLDEIETQVNELRTRRDRLQSESTTAEVVRGQRETETKLARAASEKLKLVEADYKTHVAALMELKNLESQRLERDKIRNQQAKIENEIIRALAERKSLNDNLAKIVEAKEKIVSLQPQTVEQNELESRREQLIKEKAEAAAFQKTIASLEEKILRLRESFKENNAKLKEAESKTADARQVEILQKRDTDLTNQLAEFRAGLSRDEKFQSEIRNGLCPILSQRCLNLKPGETLEGFIKTQFSETKKQIITLEVEQKEVFEALRTAREAEKFLGGLEAYRQREREIREEGIRLKTEQDALKARIENLSQLERQIAEIESRLKLLDNPKARVLAFEREARRETEFAENLSKIEKNLARLETEKSDFGEQLSKFETLDAEWKRLSDERERTAAAHREFLTNEALAKTLETREAEFAKASEKAAELKIALENSSAEFEAASQTYDRQRHLSEKAALLEAEKRLAETRATFEAAKRRESDLSAELKRLKEIRVTMQAEFKEKERLEKIGEATDFIRETLKEAAPRVARNYVYHVSLEANQMYREITGNAERTLKWTEDYGIVLEENGYDRPFVNLSGGEQMAAALSVRLALLKQLSDVRLAFFDEPTTNMDAARRENLATQIGNIRHFDQLFVISHDDTFEGYVDNVISVGAEAAVSENE
ncbi:MAG: AAA family ATPase [Acidobacteriota bacterium]|nr:AAA family ATPase [Acidobacteriota bacterium]